MEWRSMEKLPGAPANSPALAKERTIIHLELSPPILTEEAIEDESSDGCGWGAAGGI